MCVRVLVDGERERDTERERDREREGNRTWKKQNVQIENWRKQRKSWLSFQRTSWSFAVYWQKKIFDFFI